MKKTTTMKNSFGSTVKNLLGLGCLALAGALIAGCGNGNSIGPSANTLSRVRTIDALVDYAPKIDMAQTGTVTTITPAGGLGYFDISGSATEPYSSVRAGNGISYGIYTTGTFNNSIAEANITLAAHDTNSNNNSGTYTLAAVGFVTGGSGNTVAKLVRLVDGFPNAFTGTSANTAAIRLVNLSPTAGTISLFSNGSLLTGSDAAGVSNVVYAGTPGIDASHYNSGVATTAPLNLTIRNSANAILPTTSNTSAVTLLPNHAYTLFVFGLTGTAPAHPLDVKLVQDF